jgi:hypothetical protein
MGKGGNPLRETIKNLVVIHLEELNLLKFDKFIKIRKRVKE